MKATESETILTSSSSSCLFLGPPCSAYHFPLTPKPSSSQRPLTPSSYVLLNLRSSHCLLTPKLHPSECSYSAHQLPTTVPTAPNSPQHPTYVFSQGHVTPYNVINNIASKSLACLRRISSFTFIICHKGIFGNECTALFISNLVLREKCSASHPNRCNPKQRACRRPGRFRRGEGPGLESNHDTWVAQPVDSSL